MNSVQIESKGKQHVGVGCDGCQQAPIVGKRWKCRVCSNYDLCSECLGRAVHAEVKHDFREVSTKEDMEVAATKLKGQLFDDEAKKVIEVWPYVRIHRPSDNYYSDCQFVQRRLNLHVDAENRICSVGWN